MIVTTATGVIDAKTDQSNDAEKNFSSFDSDRAEKPSHVAQRDDAAQLTPLPNSPPQGGWEQQGERSNNDPRNNGQRGGRQSRQNNQPRRDKRDVHGWVVLDKPIGMTSTQAVPIVKRPFQARRPGHPRTLDPLPPPRPPLPTPAPTQPL